MRKKPALNLTLEYCSGGLLKVGGELDRHTVVEAYEQSSVYFNGTEALSIDLSTVKRADSAGLALLLAWLRRARRQKIALQFINLPEQMKDIGRVSGLDHLLPLSK